MIGWKEPEMYWRNGYCIFQSTLGWEVATRPVWKYVVTEPFDHRADAIQWADKAIVDGDTYFTKLQASFCD